MIKVENLIKTYKKRNVVNNVSLNISQGEIVGLLGPNGAGKTTTFYMISGLIFPDKGEVFLENSKINHLTIYERAKKGITYLPQEPSIFRKLSVKENIIAVLELIHDKTTDNLEEIANDVLNEYGISHIKDSKGYEISGGERRRVEIARALLLNPKFILLDEPFAGIDPIIVNDLQTIIKHLKDKNIGVLISDHNVRETLKICDRAYILNEGEVLINGIPNDIINSPDAKKVYLGEEFKI